MTAGADRGMLGRCARGHDDTGLTTLEWLLVVAAIAALAAVAVVLVQRVVSGTAEQLEANRARVTAADLAADEITREHRSTVPVDQDDADRINKRFNARCRQLEILYSDVGVEVRPKEGTFLAGTGWDPNPPHPGCSLLDPGG